MKHIQWPAMESTWICLLGKIREMTLRIFGQILAKILFCLQQFDKSLNMKGKQSPATEIMWICRNNLTEQISWNHMKRTYFWRILETFSANVQRNGWPGRQTSFTYCAGWSANDTHNRNSSRIFVNSNELYEGTYMQSIYLPFAMLSHRGS